jgi:uncharacterized protein YqjF (DUF2071 family)
VLPLDEYLALREPPRQPVVMYQSWRSLLFLHFSCDPEEIQNLLPRGLAVDTFDGKAWVGLVPFRMERIRPRSLPGFPGHTAFPETNVRTYVHREGHAPGVWFFSLDAASPVACQVARTLWQLPYHPSAMTLNDQADEHCYTSTRKAGGAEHKIVATIGTELGSAAEGTLEFFLVERYLLYAERAGKLYHGRVHHAAYQLRAATVQSVDESMIAAAGIEPRPFEHVLYSPGVDVRIYPLLPTKS